MIQAPLIVNQDCVNFVIDDIPKFNQSVIPQPIAIIGRSGSGKTEILRRISTKIPTAKFIDGKHIFSTYELMPLIANESVVLLDNAQYYFERTSSEEQYKLRAVLNRNGAPTIVASFDKVPKAFTDYKAPFFDGFKFIFIKPVEPADCGDIDMERLSAIYSLMPPTIHSLNVAYNLILNNPDPQKDIDFAIDFQSQYFGQLYDSLPTNSQRIVNALANTSEGLLLADLKKVSGLDGSVISSYMQRLVRNNLVIKEVPKTYKTSYRLSDRLFALWVSRQLNNRL